MDERRPVKKTASTRRRFQTDGRPKWGSCGLFPQWRRDAWGITFLCRVLPDLSVFPTFDGCLARPHNTYQTWINTLFMLYCLQQRLVTNLPCTFVHPLRDHSETLFGRTAQRRLLASLGFQALEQRRTSMAVLYQVRSTVYAQL